jgi:hypothetical protein
MPDIDLDMDWDGLKILYAVSSYIEQTSRINHERDVRKLKESINIIDR